MVEGSSIARAWILFIVSTLLMTMGVQCEEDTSDTASGTSASSQGSETQVAETNESHAGAVARTGELSSQGDAQKSSLEIYKDRNSYFVAVVPPGWKTQEYPAETIRTKLKFNHPTLTGVNIGIIAGPSPRTPYSLDDLLNENEAKREEIRRVAPGASFTVSKVKLVDREAVVSRLERGGGEMESVTFVEGDMFYQITLNTGSQKERSTVSDTFHRFLKSFAILEKGKKLSDADRKAVLVSRYTSLAKLYEGMGMKDEALESVREGLEIELDNRELQDIQAKLTGNLK